MSLKNICSEYIKDYKVNDEEHSFYYGQFREFKLVIDKTTGFFNATKLCKQGNKKYNDWYVLKRTKDLLEHIKSKGVQDRFLYEVKSPNNTKEGKEISGTYVHKNLFENIVQWMISNSLPICNKGFVYVISSQKHMKQNIFKIGYTKDLQRRLKQFNEYRIEEVDSLFEILHSFELENAYEKEQKIHKQLKEYRIRNTEFFKCDLEIILEAINKE